MTRPLSKTTDSIMLHEIPFLSVDLTGEMSQLRNNIVPVGGATDGRIGIAIANTGTRGATASCPIDRDLRTVYGAGTSSTN